MSSNRRDPLLSSAGLTTVDSAAKPQLGHDDFQKNGLPILDDTLLKSSHPTSFDGSFSSNGESADSFVVGSQAHILPATPGSHAGADGAVTNPTLTHTFAAAHKFDFSQIAAASQIHSDVTVGDPIHLGDSLAVSHTIAGSETTADVHRTLAGAVGSHIIAPSLHAEAVSHDASTAPDLDPDGQLWEADAGDTSGNSYDGGSDVRLEHDDSDALSDDSIDEHGFTSAGALNSVGLDQAADLWFTVDNDDVLHVGHISTGLEIGSGTTIASTSDQDLVWSMVVDPRHDVIYEELFGGDYTVTDSGEAHQRGGEIIKITYNPTTGAISSPYNPSTFSNNNHDILADSGSSNNEIALVRGMALSADGSTMYFAEDNDGDPGSFWGFKTNGIYSMSTSGDVGDGTAPTPTLLSIQSAFPTTYANGYITGIAVNNAQGIIYFTTDASAENANTGEDAIYWMPIAGGAANKMTLPAGTTLDYDAFFSDGVSFDPQARDLYVSDIERDAILRLRLSADGKSFLVAGSSGDTTSNETENDFHTVDNNGADGAFTSSMTWATLPTETGITGTSSITTQGSGSGTSLLTANPTISDAAGTGLNISGATIRVIGGHKGDSTAFGVTTGAIASATGLTGDELLANGQQSGTIDSGKITLTWNAATQTLTMTGDTTYSDYITALRSVTFQETGSTDNTIGSHPTRVIDFILNDGITVVHPSTNDPNEGTITITLNRAPTLGADSYTAQEGNSATGTSGTAGTGVLGNDSDADGDSLAISAVNGNGANVGSGTLAGTYGHLNLASNGSFTYSADNTSAIDSATTGSHPVDTFTYTVSDGDGGTTTQTVSFTINRAPTLGADSYNVVESASATGTSGTAGTGVLGNDSDRDGDSLTVSALNGSAGNLGSGTFQGTYGHFNLAANGSFTYTADNTSAIDTGATGSHLTDTFTYTDSDGHGGSTTQTVTFTIDRAPTLAADAYNVVESASVSGTSGTAGTGVLGNDSDKDGDSLTVSAVNGSGGNVGTSLAGTYGHLNLASDGHFTYTADNTSAIDSAATGSHLTDTFTYTDSDGHGGTTSNTVTFTLDRAPTVVTQNETVAESGSTSGTGGTSGNGALAGDSDRDGDGLQVTAVNGASFGDSSIAGNYGHLVMTGDGTYSYVADDTSAINSAPTGSHPIDTFNITVSDGHGGTTVETLNFSIDRPGIAVTDPIPTHESDIASASTRSTGLLGNDTDPDTNTNAGLSVTGAVVNGTAVTLGSTATFADGSTIVINADGTYSYDPNHAWDYLPDPSSGAPSTGTETFSYTITGGATITDTITITGQDSNDTLQGSSGNDTYTGGIGDDIFKMQDGGTDNVDGGSGDDSFYFGAVLTASDTVNGNTGSDKITITGDYTGGNALVLSATTLTSVELINLGAGFNYNITTNDATVASGQTLSVHGGNLGSGNSLTFDGSAETDGKFAFFLGAGDDNVTGGAGNDTFDLSLGGHDTANGGAGDDTFTMLGAFTAGDAINGGTGTNDTLVLNGDYTGGNAVVMGATTITNIDVIRLSAGNSYDLTTNDANVASGAVLKVNGGAMGSGDHLTFNGTAETDGSFSFLAGAGNDVLTGGSGNDTFNLSEGGNDTAHGGAGNDVFVLGAAFTAADTIDGGTGQNVLELNGDYSDTITFGSTTISGIENITFGAGHNYSFVLDSTNVAANGVLTINASNLGSGNSLTLDGSAITATGAKLLLDGGAGNDDLIGGNGNDVIKSGNGTDTLMGNAGADTMTGGTGADTFAYNFATDSSSTVHDTITNMNFTNDLISILGTTVTGIDTTVTSGELRGVNFDHDLALAIGAGQLAPHHAVLFDPTVGSYAGHTILVVDMNGTAGYQMNGDLVIDVTGYTGTLSTSVFGS
ncbi:MAG TPA: VCBS domain-containing protein [Rhizomicrobium sp.]